MTELEAQDQIRRAGEAGMILNHELVRDAILALKADQYEKLEATKPSQKDEREFIYHQIRAINNFEAQFQFHIDEGRVARGWLDEYRQRQKASRRR